ncbi:hypothetical protein B9Z45_06190 [Limnohabitans sp. 2KL-17]|uniref:hypothetical protein n=1 Tax=Limnohabitans sp. 2KL-17 TaxID=1100704 RepID=UPI000D34FA16|nr:hypothetical protein [Limnohabitans sp. 2KL-17]PUE60909.1 hypothetical protein B9Z45_06190 [Limnohabitans sp. 2KL-17]
MLQLYYIKIYTNILSLSELGHYAYWITVAYFFSAFVFVPFDNYQQSRIYIWKKNGVSLRSAIQFNLILLFGCALIIAIVAILTLIFFSLHIALALTISLFYGLVLHVSNASRNLANNLNYRSMAASFLIIDSLLKIIILIILQRFVVIDGIILIASATLAILLSSAISLGLMLRGGVFFAGTTETINIKEVFEFSYPISISAILNWLQLQGYKLVLVPFGAAEAVGIFSTVSSIGAACMASAGSIYAQMKTPEIYRSNGRSINAYLGGVVALIVVVALCGWLFSGLIISLLTTKNLTVYANLLVFGILVEGGNLILGAMGIAHSLNRSTSLFIGIGSIGLFSCIVAFAVLFNWLNVMNIGYPLLFSQIATGLCMWNMMKRSGWMPQPKQSKIDV